MAIRFTYFGFEYEILEGKQNEVALIEASKAHGKVFIPKEVEYEGKQYAVTQITGKEVDYHYLEQPDDKRKKPEIKYSKRYRGAFQSKIHNGKEERFGWKSNENEMEIIIPNSVTSIGESAFEACTALTSIEIPNSVTSIGRDAFYICTSLTSVTIPNSITSIVYYAFGGCTGLSSVTIPSSIKTIASYAFGRIANLEVEIHNEEGAVIIDPDAFSKSAKIKWVGKPKEKPVTEEKPAEQKPAQSVSIDLEKLIAAALVDGVVTDKERAILCKKVKEAGGDVDEFEMLLDARIYEAQQKAKPAAPKAEPKKEEPKPEPKKDEPKPAPAKPASASSTDGKMTVAQLAADFKAQFGSVLRIYNGRSKADNSLSLQEVGLTGNLALSFDGNQKVGDFIAQMAQVGLKVKVYTCDEWVACLDGLTLTQTGQVKKCAVKADMEKML